MKNTSINQSESWRQLVERTSQAPLSLKELFRGQGNRHQQYQITTQGITLDYAYQPMDQTILTLLVGLLKDANFEEQRASLFQGEPVNFTEHRPALHMALRHPTSVSFLWPDFIQNEVVSELRRLQELTARFIARELLGFTRQPLNTVVNLGIGGSDLGPKMVVEALSHLPRYTQDTQFLANPDPWALSRLLEKLNPQTTLFILSSKSLSTVETLLNYQSICDWLRQHGCTEQQLHQHFVVVSAATERARSLGFDTQRLFTMWDFVGGRYSLWSAIGLPIALTYGWAVFEALLNGGGAMDLHFLRAPLLENLPVMLALTGVLNRNFLHRQGHMMALYDGRLSGFTEFIQQLDMESNGKHVNRSGEIVSYQTSPIVWGGLGINGQHAYYQAVHQGTIPTAVDFIGVKGGELPSLHRFKDHQRLIEHSLLAQAKAMALGRQEDETRQQLVAEGWQEPELSHLIPHRCFDGEVASNLIWLDELTPAILGALIVAYEHKVFTQSVIWQINAFDQWGVELGKTLLTTTLK